jgi:membrane-associated phospholipid phosphatase
MAETNELTPLIGKPYTSYNRYFLIPFLVWVVFGGIALLSFDRLQLFRAFNTHYSSLGDAIMIYVTRMGEGVFVTVVLLLLLARTSLRSWWFVIAAFFTNAIPNLIAQALKSGFNAPRPLNYFEEAPWIHVLPEWPRFMERSFPSGHTTCAFCLYCFLAVILPPRYKIFGMVFFFLALAVGYSRMYLAAHFFVDVYVGSIIGTVFTLVIVALMDKYQGRFFKERPETV